MGIDPDLVKSGMAIVRDGKLVELYSFSFPFLLRAVKNILEEGPIVIVEEVEADKTTYHRGKTNARQHAKIAQNVGQVKGVKRVLVECLVDMGADVRLVKPLRSPVKKKAKTDAKYFNKITGWQGQSNEDKRDAALLALWG